MVLILSKGSEPQDVATEARAEAPIYIAVSLVLDPMEALATSTAVSYVTNMKVFRAIALIIVGRAPFQRLVTPSSFAIRVNASPTCL